MSSKTMDIKITKTNQVTSIKLQLVQSQNTTEKKLQL